MPSTRMTIRNIVMEIYEFYKDCYAQEQPLKTYGQPIYDQYNKLIYDGRGKNKIYGWHISDLYLDYIGVSGDNVIAYVSAGNPREDGG